MSKEQWKPIPGFDGYEASNMQRVRSVKSGKIMSLTINGSGYPTVGVTMNKKTFTVLAHRLIALAWIPNPLGKPQINHINGNRSDNRLENLEWCTQSENIQHAYDIGFKKPYKKTEKHLKIIGLVASRPITVKNIATGEPLSFTSMRECAKRFNVDESAISQAVRRGSVFQKIYIITKDQKQPYLAIDKETLNQ